MYMHISGPGAAGLCCSWVLEAAVKYCTCTSVGLVQLVFVAHGYLRLQSSIAHAHRVAPGAAGLCCSWPLEAAVKYCTCTSVGLVQLVFVAHGY